MKIETLLVVLLVASLSACGGSSSPQVVADDGGQLDQGTGGADADEIVCVPACGLRLCGDNGCGGSCGSCKPLLESCSAEGQCAAFPCANSIDCPGDLVCAEEAGECVVCVGPEDCAEGEECGADHLCHEQHPCDSDKDCKEFGLLCDKGAGICVQCTKSSHCSEEQFCLDGSCVDAACAPGKLTCNGDEVHLCSEDGSGFARVESCAVSTYCLAGECVPYVCKAGTSWCEEKLLLHCAEDGRSIAKETDCAAQSATCINGACVPLECTPLETWCTGDFAAAACDQTGLQITEAPCPSEQFCLDGGCQPMVCKPDAVYCDGEIYKVCDAKGSQVQYEEDCGAKGQHCFAGSCIDTVCAAQTKFCVDGSSVGDCAEDGMSFSSSPCQDQHFCAEGACFPWVCEPANAFCIGNAATLCDTLGSGLLESVDCGDKICADGACIDCPPQCDGKSCGGDGCGGSCGTCPPDLPCVQGQCAECSDGNESDWDGCTNDGSIAEFQVNMHSAGKQYGTGVDSWTDGSFAVVWSGAGEGVADGVWVRRFNANGEASTGDLWVDETGTGTRTQARVRTDKSGRYIVVWRRGEIYSRLYDADNQPLTGIVLVSTNDGSGTHTEPTVDFFSDGSHVIMWHMNNSVFTQRFLPTGAKVGSNFVISQGTGRTPSVRALASDEVVATYHRYADGSGNGIFARYLNNEFTPYANQYLVNQTTNKNQEVGVLGLLPDDVLVAIWSSDQQDGSATGVFGQRFSPDGSKIGVEFQASTYTKGAQGGLWAQNNKILEYRRTALATFAGGGFVVVWESHDQVPGGLWDVFGQRLDNESQHVGVEFPVNTFTAGIQETCSVATLPGGGIVVTWASADQDGSGHGVFAQRFDAQGKRLQH